MQIGFNDEWKDGVSQVIQVIANDGLVCHFNATQIKDVVEIDIYAMFNQLRLKFEKLGLKVKMA